MVEVTTGDEIDPSSASSDRTDTKINGLPERGLIHLFEKAIGLFLGRTRPFPRHDIFHAPQQGSSITADIVKLTRRVKGGAVRRERTATQRPSPPFLGAITAGRPVAVQLLSRAARNAHAAQATARWRTQGRAGRCRQGHRTGSVGCRTPPSAERSSADTWWMTPHATDSGWPSWRRACRVLAHIHMTPSVQPSNQTRRNASRRVSHSRPSYRLSPIRISYSSTLVVSVHPQVVLGGAGTKWQDGAGGVPGGHTTFTFAR